ncbi:hypothetical protein BLNAU_13099 [Blattamonas nauphoetae]|uniref:Uncharacterized protein n=1 Tax=Blattamonas nauphoetae TaxID=2049346 RepID=A0ABQ9XMG4_9EUKA|nr:hypothetical protein BLNAU_13099 [Blattamonas nauphoetae]
MNSSTRNSDSRKNPIRKEHSSQQQFNSISIDADSSLIDALTAEMETTQNLNSQLQTENLILRDKLEEVSTKEKMQIRESVMNESSNQPLSDSLNASLSSPSRRLSPNKRSQPNRTQDEELFDDEQDDDSDILHAHTTFQTGPDFSSPQPDRMDNTQDFGSNTLTLIKFEEMVAIQEDLATELRTTKTALDKAEEELTQNRRALTELSSRKNDQEGIISMLRQELQKERMKTIETEKSIQQMREQEKSDAERKVADLQKEAAEAIKREQQASTSSQNDRQEMSEMKIHLSKAEADKKRAEDEYRKIEAKLEKYEEEMKVANATMLEAQQKQQEAEGSLLSARKENQSLAEQLKKEKDDWEIRSEILTEQVHHVLELESTVRQEKEDLEKTFIQQREEWRIERVNKDNEISRLKETLDRITHEKDSVLKEHTKSSSESDGLKSKMSKTAEDVQTLSLDLKRTQALLQETQESLATQKQLNSTLKTDLAEATEALKQATEELEEKRAYHQTSEAQISELSSKVSVLLRSSSTENRVLLTKIREAEEKNKAKIDERDKIIEALRATLSELQNTAAQATKDKEDAIRSKDRTIEALRLEKERIERDLAEEHERNEVYRLELNVIDDDDFAGTLDPSPGSPQSTSHLADTQALSEQPLSSTFRSQAPGTTPRIRRVQKMRAEREVLARNLNDLDQTISQLKDELKQAQFDLAQRTKGEETAKKTAEVERKVNQSEIVSLRRTVDQFRREKEELEKRLKQVEEERGMLERERNELKEEQERIANEFGQVEEERERIKQFREELENLKGTTEMNETIRQTTSKITQDNVREMEDKLRSLEEQLDEAELTIVKLEAEKNGKSSSLTTELDRTRILLENTEAQLKDLREENDKLRTDIRKLRNEVDLCHENMKETEKRSEEMRRSLKAAEEELAKKSEEERRMRETLKDLEEDKRLKEEMNKNEQRKRESERRELEKTLERKTSLIAALEETKPFTTISPSLQARPYSPSATMYSSTLPSMVGTTAGQRKVRFDSSIAPSAPARDGDAKDGRLYSTTLKAHTPNHPSSATGSYTPHPLTPPRLSTSAPSPAQARLAKILGQSLPSVVDSTSFDTSGGRDATEAMMRLEKKVTLREAAE